MTISRQSLIQDLETYKRGTPLYRKALMELSRNDATKATRARDDAVYQDWYRDFRRRHGMGIQKIAALIRRPIADVRELDRKKILVHKIKLARMK